MLKTKYTNLIFVFLTLIILALSSVSATDLDNNFNDTSNLDNDFNDNGVLNSYFDSNLDNYLENNYEGDSLDSGYLSEGIDFNKVSAGEDNQLSNLRSDNQIYVDSSVDESGNGEEDSPFKTIKDAIDASSSGYEIIVKEGTYYEYGLNIDKNLTITADGNVIIDGLNNGLILNDEGYALILNGLTFKNGFQEENSGYYAYSCGGVIALDYSINTIIDDNGDEVDIYNYPSLIANDCSFISNHAGYGGAVYGRAADISLENCLFDSNMAYGGAIYLESNSQLIADNCSFINNTGNRGAIVYAFGSAASFNDSRFYSNTANLGLFYTNSQPSFAVDITKSILINNTGNASILYLNDGKFNISSSIIENNPILNGSEYKAFTFGSGTFNPVYDLNDNYWGTNTPDFNALSTRENETNKISSWIVTSVSPNEINSNDEIAIDFRKNNNGEDKQIADGYIPNLTTSLGSLFNITATSNGTATAILTTDSPGIAEISLNNQNIANVTINSNSNISLIITVDNITVGEDAIVKINLTSTDSSNNSNSSSNSSNGTIVYNYTVENDIIINDENYHSYFNDDGTLIEDAIDGSTIYIDFLNNKNLTISKELNIMAYPEKGIISNGTITITKDASKSNISYLRFNNFNQNAINLNDEVSDVNIYNNQINITTLYTNTSLSVDAIYGLTALENINMYDNIISMQGSLSHVYGLVVSGWTSGNEGSRNSREIAIKNNKITINSTDNYASGMYLDSISDSIVDNNTINVVATGNASFVYGIQIADSSFSASFGEENLLSGLQAPTNITISSNTLDLSSPYMIYGLTALSIGRQSSNGLYYSDSYINISDNIVKAQSDKGVFAVAMAGASESLIDNNFIDIIGGDYGGMSSADMLGVGADAIALIKDSYSNKDSNNDIISNNIINTNVGFINITDMDETINNITIVNNNEYLPNTIRLNATVMVTVNNVDYNVVVTNGYGSISIPDLEIANYTANASFVNENYSATASTVFEVREVYHGIIYVSTTGSDSNEGSINLPVLTIAHAIELATGENSSHSIILFEGTFNENELDVSETYLSISGAGIDKTIIDATFTGGKIFLNYLSNLTIANLTLANSINTVESGGAIENMGNASLDYVKIVNCSSESYNGGAIFSVGNLLINNSIFTNNNASGAGGAIYLQDQSSLLGHATSIYMANSIFENNTAKTSSTGGGAIYAQQVYGTKTIINCSFENNKAAAGGAILIQQSNGSYINIHNSTFANNQATGSTNYGGGALCLVGLTNYGTYYNANLSYCEFSNNIASNTAGGGAVYIRAINTNLTNSLILFNYDENNKSIFKELGYGSYPDSYYYCNLNISDNWWGSNDNPVNLTNYIYSTRYIFDDWILMTSTTIPSDLSGFKAGDIIEIDVDFTNYMDRYGVNGTTNASIPYGNVYYNAVVNAVQVATGTLTANDIFNNYTLRYTIREGENLITLLRDGESQVISFNASAATYQGAIYISNDGSDSDNDGSKAHPFKTISHGIEIANLVNEDNVTIYIFNGTYYENNLIIENIGKNISIIGLSDGVVIDGSSEANSLFIIRNSTVLFENLTFTNVNGSIKGGAISLVSNENRETIYGNITIDNCVFTNMNVSQGGAIYVNYGNGTLRVNNSSFSNLNASSWGAAISVGYSSGMFNVAIDSSTFTNNHANNGILYLWNNLTHINNSSIFNNSVYSSGAVYLRNSTGFIDNCLIYNNSADNNAIAIEIDGAYNDTPVVTVTRSIIENNTCTADLIPAILVNRGTLNISYSSIVNDYSLETVTSSSYDAVLSQGVAIADNNWWGLNNPFNEINGTNITIDKWIIMNITAYTRSTLNIGDEIRVVIDFNHVNTTDGIIEDLNLSSFPKSFNIDILSVGGTINSSSPQTEEGIASLIYTVTAIDDNYLNLTCDKENIIFRFITSNYVGIIYVSKDGSDTNEGSMDAPVSTISRAIELASSTGMPGEIIINEGRYFETNLVIGSNLTITGLGDVVIDGNHEDGLIYVNGSAGAEKVLLNNLTLTGGDSNYGVAIYNYYSNVFLNNLNISGNSAGFDSYGYPTISVIYNGWGNLTISNSIISNNGEKGLINNAGNLTIFNSTFINNTALGGGYGLIFSNNNYYSSDTLNIFNSTFINNTDNQGIIHNSYTNTVVNIENSSFIDNLATLGSGGVVHSEGTLNVYGSYFENNTANRFGGAIYSTGNAKVLSSIFVNNIANLANEAYDGNDIVNDNYGNLTIQYCVVLSNITTNAKYSLYNDGNAQSSVDANCNWWGTNDGPDGLVGSGSYTEYSNPDALIPSPEVDASKWIIMSLYNDEDYNIRATLDKLNTGEIINGTLAIREVLFSPVDYFNESLSFTDTNGVCVVNYTGDLSKDYITATIDYQTLVFGYFHYPEIDTNTSLVGGVDVNSTGFNIISSRVNTNTTITAHVIVNTSGIDDVSELNLSAVLTGDVSFYINGSLIGSFELIDGVATVFYLTPSNIGNYTVLATYNGDYNYKPSNATAILEVLEYIDTELISVNESIFAGDDYRIKIVDEDSNPLANKTILVKIISDDNSYNMEKEYVSDLNGCIYVGNLSSANYTITAIFAGDEDYWTSSLGRNISIIKKNTGLAILNTSIILPENLTIKMVDLNSNLILSNKTINLSVIDSTGKITTYILLGGGDGLARLSLAYGTYVVRAVFAGDDYYLNSSISSFITVLKAIDVRDGKYIQEAIDNASPGDTIDLGNYTYIDVADVNITKNITIIGGVIIPADNGLNLSNASSTPSNINSVFNLIPKGENGPDNLTIANMTFNTNGDTTLFNVQAIDNGYASEVAEININGIVVNANENPNSVVVLKLITDSKLFNPTNSINVSGNTLTTGVKPFVLENTNWNNGSNIIIPKALKTKTVFTVEDVATGKAMVIATLKDVNNNLLADKNISYIINGTEYINTTNSNGQVVISNLTGDAIIIFVFAGDDSYSASNASINFISAFAVKVAKLIFSNMTTTAIYTARSGEYFYARLVDDDGVGIANKTVQIGFNGATYKRVTDENGGFKLQVNLKVAGGYTFATCFLGDGEYNSAFGVAKIIVEKANTILTNVKSKYTYKASNTNKSLSATLKLSNGTAISGKTIKFTVNGKTYSGTTNSKGVATVKLSITAKRTYIYTVDFAGSSQLSKSNTSGRLLIK